MAAQMAAPKHTMKSFVSTVRSILGLEGKLRESISTQNSEKSNMTLGQPGTFSTNLHVTKEQTAKEPDNSSTSYG